MMNLKAIEESLKGANVTEELKEMDLKNPMWHGMKEVKLVDIQETENKNAFTLVFADTNNELMPSQFDGQVGNIYVRKDAFRNFILSAKFALNLDSKLDMMGTLEELSNNYHNIAFAIKHTIQQWGISYYNIIDWKATKQA